MKTVVYARKSEESDDRQVQSIGDQEAAMTAMARSDGFPVDEVYADARSAKEPDTRPEFRRLLEDVRAGRVARIYVWALNRLSRNEIDGNQIAYLLRTGRLESVRTSTRTYRPEDSVLLMAIENGMATAFIQDLRRNVVRGMDGKAARGWRPGRAPLGYVNNPETREIDPDPVRFPLVRAAWEMMLTGGHTPSQVYHAMVGRGLTSRARRGTVRPLSMGQVYSMFSNPFYKGSFAYKGEVRPGRHQPIVTGEEFDAVQATLGRKAIRRKRKNDFAFAGLLRCGRCGCNVVADRKVKRYAGTGRTVEYVYYHCTNGRGGCSKAGVPEEEVARWFEEAMASIAIPEPFGAWVVDQCARLAEGDALATAAGLVSLAERAEAVGRRLDRLRQMRIDEELSAEEYRELKGTAEAERSSLLREREAAAERDARALRTIREKVALSIQAEGYADEEAARRRGMALSLGAVHSLNLGELRISMHPVIEKIAALGPLRNGSETPKVGDPVPSTSIWYTFARDILTLARQSENDWSEVAPFDRLESIKRYKGRQERGWDR